MNKWTEIFVGLILLIGVIIIGWASSVYSWTIFGKDLDFLHSAWILLKGGIFWLAIMISLVLLMLGISDLRD